MSFTTTRQAIVDVLKTYAGDPPIFAENITVPAGAQNATWVRWSIRPATAVDMEVGGQQERIVGALYFQHFVNEGGGTKEAWDFCDKIGALFNRKKSTFSGGLVTFERAVCAFAAAIDGKVQHNITVAFREDAVALNAP